MDKLLKNFNKIDFSSVSGDDGTVKADGITMTYEFAGKGGQGKVYATDFKIDGKKLDNLAVKIGSPEDDLEAKIAQLMSESKVPNFLTIYKDIEQKGKNIKLMDRADGNLEQWIREKRDYSDWKSFVIQITLAVQYMKLNKICHSDMKPKNILFRKNTTKGDLKYSFEGVKTTLKSPSYVFYITDFGHSEGVDVGTRKMTETEIESCISNNTDLIHLVVLDKRIKASYMTKMFDRDEMEEIIEKNDDEGYKTYLKSEKDTIWEALEEYPRKIKERMLTKSVAYYLVEKNYFDFSKVPNDISKQKLPPDEAVSLMQKVFGSKEDLVKTLKDHKLIN